MSVAERALWLLVIGNPGRTHQRTRDDGAGVELGRPTSIVEHYVTSWVLKLPAFLYLCAATASITTPLTAENIHRMKHHDVWRLPCLFIFSRADLVIKFGGGQRRQIRRIRRGN